MKLDPVSVKAALESLGYNVYSEDKKNWVMGVAEDDDPLLLAKKGSIPRAVLHYIMCHAKANGKHEALAKALGISPLTSPPPVNVISPVLSPIVSHPGAPIPVVAHPHGPTGPRN
jgi:hypothetical protein